MNTPLLDIPAFWLLLGFGGQALFSARFIVQWIASERRRQSVVPLAFWFLSLAGGSLLLAYAIHRQDPVIIFGQLSGLVVYSRNLWLIYHQTEDKVAAANDVAPAPATG